MPRIGSNFALLVAPWDRMAYGQYHYVARQYCDCDCDVVHCFVVHGCKRIFIIIGDSSALRFFSLHHIRYFIDVSKINFGALSSRVVESGVTHKI